MRRLLFFFLCIIPALSFAQQDVLKGTIYDATSKEPLLGATVQNRTKNTAAVTDFDGLFTLKAEVGDRLTISYVGYATQDFVLENLDDLSLFLIEDVSALNEVIVIGYGTQAVREITGSVSIVDSETIEDLKPVRVEQALQGTAPGVTVTSSSGAPGAAPNIRIRGIGTNGDARPLILVDGIRIEDLSVLNPGDIESFSVLKDATAGIYGVQAANGVILITTKSGRKGQPLKVEYNAYAGWQETTRKLPTLNAQQYALIKNEAYANNGQALPFSDLSQLTDTDYQDVLFDEAFQMNHDISVKGGTDKSVYAAGMSYLKQDGILSTDKSKFERFTFRGNFDHQWTDKLSMKTGALYSWTASRGINTGGLGSILFNAVNISPTIPVRDENGDFSLADQIGLGNEIVNPVAQLSNTFNRNYVGRISGNFGLTYEIIDGLEVTSRIQANYAETYGRNFGPRAQYGPGKVFNLDENIYNTYSNYFRDYIFDNFINYNKTFNEIHDLSVTLGTSASRETGKFNGFTGINSEPNGFNEVDLTTAERVEDNIIGAGTFDARLLSQFVRVQYDYDDKYLFSGVLRRDGSSKFGPNNKFGYFPSASAGWIISNEEFLNDSNKLSFLKLRVSSGLIGSDRIGNFGFVSTLTGESEYILNDQLVRTIAAVGQPGNPDIKWEEVFTTNIGVDANFLDGKLTTVLELYQRDTIDLLFIPPASGIIGIGAPGSLPPVINGGDIRNKGIEFAIGYSNDLSEKASFSVNYNITTIDNEVTFVNNPVGFFEDGGFGVGQPPIARFEKGQTIGYFNGLISDGIFQNAEEVAAHADQSPLGVAAQPGDIRYRDLNGDGVINLDDRTNLGDAIPDVTMGLNFQFNYGNWDLNTYLYASIGNEMVRNYERVVPLANTTVNILDRWTGPGTSNTVPRVTTAATTNELFSDYFVEDASFMRINNMQIGYTLNTDLLNNLDLSSVRFYAAVDNFLTLTEYRGFDPSATSGAALGAGIDSGFYPVPRTFRFGFQAKF